MYVCRSFLGITALWLYSDLLEQECAALRCRRVKGRMTFEKIAEKLENIFLEIKIQNKVVKVITDS